MDKVQFQSIIDILSDQGILAADQATKIGEILSIDLSDKAAAAALKDKIIGNGTMLVETADNQTTVSFNDVSSTAPLFSLAFIATLVLVIQNTALDKFLPEPAVEKTKSGGKRDGMGSPAPTRSIPVRNKGNY